MQLIKFEGRYINADHIDQWYIEPESGGVMLYAWSIGVDSPDVLGVYPTEKMAQEILDQLALDLTTGVRIIDLEKLEERLKE